VVDVCVRSEMRVLAPSSSGGRFSYLMMVRFLDSRAVHVGLAESGRCCCGHLEWLDVRAGCIHVVSRRAGPPDSGRSSSREAPRCYLVSGGRCLQLWMLLCDHVTP